MKEEPVISVLICTYNQEKYIEQAVKSALMQVTNQRYEILIGDDCSSDNTLLISEKIQKDNPNTVFVFPTQTNMGSTQNLLRLIDASRDDFIAILDGDDYWTDSSKLNRQWEIVSNNPEIGMVCSYASTWDQSKSRITGRLGSTDVLCFNKLISGDIDVAAPTLFLRKSLLQKCILESQWFIRNNLFYDSIISYWFSFYSKIHFIPEELAVYRVLPNSSCHSTNEEIAYSYQKRYFSVKLRFVLEHPVPRDLVYNLVLNEWEKNAEVGKWQSEKRLRASLSFRLGKFLLKPFQCIKHLTNNR